MDIPNARNFCGGNFPDWLEVNLLPECNGKCSWCVERKGWHPKLKVGWRELVSAIEKSGKKNIILLGGEPTLHPNLMQIIEHVTSNGQLVWLTTNGSKLSVQYVADNLLSLQGINISIHHYDMYLNSNITGIELPYDLTQSLKLLKKAKVRIRLNCNCIKCYVDSVDSIREYVAYAKELGADSVRFAELKHDAGQFVDLAKVLDHKYGLNDNPFKDGCNSDCVIDGMPVNFRQMCGMQTTRRAAPKNPCGIMKQVLYYDGNFYNGWQSNKGEHHAIGCCTENTKGKVLGNEGRDSEYEQEATEIAQRARAD